ncbi:MAG: L-seryl-tRNA(Sec) selenium transferase [Ilumatobacteraceae bacterium]
MVESPMISADQRPPSVDALARQLAMQFELPHAVLVDCARIAIARGDADQATQLAAEFRRKLLTDVINATGVLLHTNLGRAPLAYRHSSRPNSLELDLLTGERGSRQRGIGRLLALLCGAEDAFVVNNNAAAILLVVSALASRRDVAVARGESVEIGGGFRIPEVLEQSGSRLVDVGTTNRTRLRDYRKAIDSSKNDIALVLKVHPSNYHMQGFVEETAVSELATLGVPVIADIGSGFIDNSCPWIFGPPPAWLANEPAAKQSLSNGASLVTFSGDKLFGGPQCGIIVGRADLIATCAKHPLARALRPGALTISSLHQIALSYLQKTVCEDVPFWKMATVPLSELDRRAEQIVATAQRGRVVDCLALSGAGSTPGSTIPSRGISIAGDYLAELRAHQPPIIARVADQQTLIDLRSVHPDDDPILVAALRSLPDK